MSNTRILASRLSNILARAALITPLTVTDENSLFPRSGLYDAVVNSPFRFNTQGATMRIDADLNLAANPGFETAFVGGLPAAAVASVGTWGKSASATLTRDTAAPRTGAGDLRVEGTAGVEYGYYDLTVQSAEVLRILVSARKGTGATPGTAIVRVQNLHTRSFMTSVGAWQTASADALNNATTAYTSATIDTTVEVATGTMPREMTLRFYFYAGGTTTDGALYDDFFVWPSGYNLTSVHGHNVSQGVTVELLGASTATPTNVRATLTPRFPAFYSTLSATLADRFIGLRFSLADLNPGGAIWLGEWVLGQSLTVTRNANYPIGTSFRDPQRRSATETGQQRAYLLTEGTVRGVSLTFRYSTLAEFQEMRDQVVKLSRNGAYPVVCVPQDDDAEIVVFGHLDQAWGIQQTFLTIRDADPLIVWEDPLPTFVP